MSTEITSLNGYPLKDETARKLAGEIVVPTNVSAFENDAGYLTKHQDISHKLDADMLPKAINTALVQAKASGEFDGEDGKTPIKGVDYWTEADQESIVQDVIAKGGLVKTNQGSANVGKILVVGADGNLTLTEMPETMSGDVVGMIDENNNIVITGALDDGTYTFKYANADGTFANIGSLTVGNGGTEITYTNLADTSAEAGWLNDKRFSTSSNDGAIKDSTSGGVITNFIQVRNNQTLRAKGLNFVDNVGDVTPAVGRYSAKDTFVSLTYFNTANGAVYDSTTNMSTINTQSLVLDGEYIRICGTLVDGYTADDVIITLDEEIT